MTVLPAEYATFLASLGNPEHHVMIGPDWWGCLCGEIEYDRGPYVIGWQHQRRFGGQAVSVHPDWHWGIVRDLAESMAELHQYLWEQEAVL